MSTDRLSKAHTARIDAGVQQAFTDLVKFRRDLHAHPELSWKEHRTADKIEEKLRSFGIAHRREIETAVIADIPGTLDVPPVIYRGDIDALPIADTKELGTVAYRSRHEGVCHACGHDVHTTIALTVAMLMHEARAELRAPVRIIFQPAEEVLPSGADALDQAGVLQEGRAALAVHVDPSQTLGNVGWLTGPITASLDNFRIDIDGHSGHSARPHLSHDAIAAAAEVTLQLHAMVRRHSNPFHTAVLSVGTLQGGVASNVIAGHAHLTGSLRAQINEDRPMLRAAVEETARYAAAIHGCTARVHFDVGHPPVRNDVELAHLVRDMAVDVLGAPHVHEQSLPSMGAEDFGHFSNRMPTFMLRLGCGVEGERPRHLHEEGFDLDERTIAVGARIMARAVLSLSRAAEG